MAKKDNITITGLDLYKGMYDSAYFGVSDIRNLDITSTPGVIKIAPKLTKESGSIVPGLIKYWDIDTNTGTVWAIDTSGQFLKRVAGTWSTVSGGPGSSAKGLIIYKDYVIVADNNGSVTEIQRYGPLSSSPSWGNIANINSSAATTENVPMMISPSDILYMGTNQYVSSITTATGSVTIGVLVIPTKYNITSLNQLGTQIYVGTKEKNGSIVSYIFPWDGFNINPGYPIPVSGAGIKQAKTLGNLLYSNSGLGGSINVTNGASVQEIKRLNIWNASPLYSFDVNPQAISTMNGGLLIGIGKTATSDNQSPVGVFYYKDKGASAKAWSYYIPSHGLDGSANQVCQIGAVLALTDTAFIVSWYDGTNYGVDLFDTTRCYSSYSAYFTSPVWQINQVLDKTALARIEFKFAKPLATDQGIKIEYRESTSDSWTVLGTWDYATNGATRNGYFNFAYSKPDLQIKVSLTTGTSNALTPELVNITLI